MAVKVLSDKIRFLKIFVVWKEPQIEENKFNRDQQMQSKHFPPIKNQLHSNGDLVKCSLYEERSQGFS
jgi:hypothetical protein